MNPDHLKQAWQGQPTPPRLSIDADLLLAEVRRNERAFAAGIFWRDACEVGVAIVMVPAWILMGRALGLPWAWYLMLPALVWIAGFLIFDRLRFQRRPAETAEPLRRHIESSRAQVEHQIWLLGNVHWWYLLPPAIAALAFFGQVAWQTRAGGWPAALVVALVLAAAAAIVAWVFSVNQRAIRRQLEPRRKELEALLAGLDDEPSAGAQ